jgi:hypothetical protein
MFAWTLTAFMVLGVLFQASGPSSDNWIDVLLKSGPWAVVVLLIILDKLTTTGERDRLRLENTELRKALEEAEQAYRKEVTPALVEGNRLLALYREPPR